MNFMDVIQLVWMIILGGIAGFSIVVIFIGKKK